MVGCWMRPPASVRASCSKKSTVQKSISRMTSMVSIVAHHASANLGGGLTCPRLRIEQRNVNHRGFWFGRLATTHHEFVAEQSSVSCCSLLPRICTISSVAPT